MKVNTLQRSTTTTHSGTENKRNNHMMMAHKLAITAAVVALASGAHAATNWKVDAGAIGANTGETWADAYTDLQLALTAAQPGDQIWVAAGMYTPSDTDQTVSFQLKTGVALYGGFIGGETALSQRDWIANETMLTGDVDRDDEQTPGGGWIQHGFNSGHVIVGSGVDATAVVDGFSIMLGATGPQGGAGNPLMFGGGLYNIAGSPTVRHCVFQYNRAAFAAGGAMYNWNSSPTVTDCVFRFNTVHLGDGGAMFNGGTSAPIIEDSQFISNSVTYNSPDGAGGGIEHEGAPITIKRCLFENNIVRPFFIVGSEPGYGGGLMSFLATDITVIDCVFRGNEANYGAGMIAWNSATVINCLFINNKATVRPADPFPEIGGIGAGLMSYSFNPIVVRAVNCTIAFNKGKKSVGVAGVGGVVSLENSIVWGNQGTSPEVVGYWTEQLKGDWEAQSSAIQHIFEPPGPGEDPLNPADLPGVVDTDPLFVAPGFAGDLHLAAGSPLIDAGNNSLIPSGVVVDLDGLARFSDDPVTIDTGLGTSPIVDMGAYEFGAGALCPTDLNADGFVNGSDLAMILISWGQSGAADLNGDGVVNGADLAMLLISWGPCV